MHNEESEEILVLRVKAAGWSGLAYKPVALVVGNAQAEAADEIAS